MMYVMKKIVEDALKDNQLLPLGPTEPAPTCTEVTRPRQESVNLNHVDIDRELVYSKEFIRYKPNFFEGKTDPLVAKD